MNKFGVILENDVALQTSTAQIMCFKRRHCYQTNTDFKRRRYNEQRIFCQNAVLVQFVSSSSQKQKKLGKNLDSVKKFPVIVYRDASINTMQLRPRCDRSLVVDLFHG